MKKRLIITLSVGVLHLAGHFFPAMSIAFLTVLVCPPTCLILGPVFVLGLFAVIIWNIVGVFRMWRSHKAKALVPLVVCIPFVFLGGIVGDLGLDLRIRSFKAQIPRFEEKAVSVVREFHERNALRNAKARSNYYGEIAGFNVYAHADSNGVPTVRFLRRISFNVHHRGYMYRADGDFESALREREGIQAPIDEKWCAIAD